ncbi:MAG: magnesium transporter [Bernardetiaceae bacterium]|jgi:magnesium transporter|nr:magnesium transporter [Bernardetiaceae bacterium]
MHETPLTEDFLGRFKAAIDLQDEKYIHSVVDDLFVQDISAILDELDIPQAKYVAQLLDSKVTADIVSNLDPDVRKPFLAAFAPPEIASFVDYMDSDDAADLLNELPVRAREEVFAQLDAEQAQYVKPLLHYEPGSAGGLMATELVKANLNWTVRQCIDEIRHQAENVDKIYSVYVVDDKNVLQGRISLKKIIIARDEQLVADLFVEDIVAVETYRDGDEVAAIMQKYDLEAIPVVNVKGELQGRITIDDMVDLIKEQAEKDLQALAGISETVGEDDSVWRLSRARLPWLLIGMLGGILGARFIGLFEGDLLQVPAMAFFIPLITATGGNVGIQSSTIIVQSLAEKDAFASSAWQRLFRVLLVAILNGLVISLVVFGFNMLLFNNLTLSVVVSIALFSVVLIASVMGTVTPLALNRLGINPALASGPFITTANDLMGLLVYFLVARLVFYWFPA